MNNRSINPCPKKTLNLKIIMIAFSLLIATVWANNFDPDVLPEKSVDVTGKVIYRHELLQKPRLIIIANRESFRLIAQTANIAQYPRETVWIPNISLAPAWMIDPIVKPALDDIAAKVSYPVIYDIEGEWSNRLKITSSDIHYLAVFYADQHQVKKVSEKWVDPEEYKDQKKQQQLVKEILSAWEKAKNEH